jgi:hypothetical protein
MDPMLAEPGGSPIVGRSRELGALLRVLDDEGPRVCFVYGMTGIGKSALLNAFARVCRDRGTPVVSIDCRAIEPTERGLLDALHSAPRPALDDDDGCSPTVVTIDAYELFRIADPWLRHDWLPSAGRAVRLVVAGREPPMLEWAVERGRLGGLEVLPLGPLGDDEVDELLRAAGVDEPDAVAAIRKVGAGHPLALRLAVESWLAGGDLPAAEAIPRVLHALASSFRDGLDDHARRALDAASVVRRVTSGVLTAMLNEDADDAVERLSRMSFVDAAPDGLVLHDAVHVALAERLRSLDPDRFRSYRAAAWHHVRAQTHSASVRELARSTADLLFLIDNPVVREAMFPTTAHRYSVEPARPEDMSAIRALWTAHDPPEGAAVLDRWADLAPHAVRVVRDRSGGVAGCSVTCEWRMIPPSLERDDPVVAAWLAHARRHPLPPGQKTLVHRRALAVGAGEAPGPVQAATMLDVKRDYFTMRPHLGRLYFVVANPEPLMPALLTLGFAPLEQPAVVGDVAFHLAALDFGPESIDGWLANLAAAELGIPRSPLLDADDRTVDVQGQRVPLSPLEYGVLEALHERSGKPVSRVDLLSIVWGTEYNGGSNVVDVVVRTLRRKLGTSASRIETVRGVGYRLR